MIRPATHEILSTYKEAPIFVFIFFLLINLISSGDTDMWDGMVTFLLTDSMALKHTAQLHPEIPSISNANAPAE
jgi:hypothetical protein